MATPRITAVEFEDQLRSAILDRNSTWDTYTGPVRDTVLAPTSRVLEDQNERIRHLSLIMSLLNVGEFTDAELDEYAFNEEALRRAGRRAITTVFFQTRKTPSVDITVPTNFPVGTAQDPVFGRSIIFRTTETLTLPSATAALYFNASSGFYELEVPVQAVAAGEDSVVAPGRINQMLASLAGFEAIVNRAASQDGKSQESNEELATRLLVAIPGTDVSTKYGTERFVLDGFPDVIDLEEVFGIDPLLTRAAENAGAVDTYIIGTVSETVTETHVFLGIGQPLVLNNQPVLSVASVDAGGPAFTAGVDYSLILDEGVNSGSIRGQDAVVFLASGTPPAIGATVNITYNTNRLIQTLQDSLVVPSAYVFGRDLLFKQGTKLSIEVDANLSVLAGSNTTTVQSAVASAVVTFINNLGLGDAVELSDVNAEVRKIAGVDNFTPTTFRIIGSGAGVADIPVSRSAYARILSGDVSITLT